MDLKRINDFVVKPLAHTSNRKKFKGSKLFNMWCPNIFALAKKNSGKTTTIINILKKMSGDLTKFIFIVSTIDKDQSYRDLLDEIGDRSETFKSIVEEDEDGIKTNVIKDFLKSMRHDDDDDILENENERGQIGGTQAPLNNFKKYQKMVGGEARVSESEKKLEQNTRWNKPYPEYIIVMDDLGSEMRDPAVTQLLKTNRHYNTMVIMSSQALTDLNKPARSQLDYMLIFPKIPTDKLKDIKEDLNLSIDLDKFIDIYNIATSEKYNFLYIGRTGPEEEYRKNFNEKFILKDE